MEGRLLAATLVAALAVLAAPALGPAVTSERVTIAARPDTVRWGTPVTLFGSVASNADEIVTIETKECAVPGSAFREAGEAGAHDGAWSAEWGVRSMTVFRAKWRDATSVTVTVHVRPSVILQRLTGNRYSVGVRALVPFWRKRVVLQRQNQQLGTWVNVKSVVLTEQQGSGISVFTSAKFRSVVPRGTVLRAVLPLSQTRPCYAAGYSNLLRK